MPNRDDVELLVHARSTLVGRAQQEFADVFSALSRKDPKTIRGTLLETVPAIVSKYGNGAAAAAADWYMQLRAKDIPGAVDFPISLGEPVADDVVRSNVRYAAKFLFGSDPAMTVSALHGAIGRHVKYAEMSTIWQMGVKDTETVRFALVPRPPMTCSFCSMLASRGWVYMSEAKATAFSSQHTGCDCSVVPSWDSEKAHIDGYDPERDYRRYKAARDDLGSGASDWEITDRMREMFPDDYTDGITPDKGKKYGDESITAEQWRKGRAKAAKKAKKGAYGHEAYARRIPPARPDRRPAGWPASFPTFDDRAWNHILYGYGGGSGHLPGYEWKRGGTPFPVEWTKADIFNAIKATIASGNEIHWRDEVSGSIRFRYKGRAILVAVKGSRANGSIDRIASAYLV